MAIVSLIMPAYNAGKYIRKTIECIIAQTYKDWELILVNDGSKDDTQTIAEDIAKEDGTGRIKITSKPNSGVSDTRNKGIALSTGKYLMFVDSDDLIKKDYIETHVNLAENYDCDLIISSITPDSTIIAGVYKYNEVYNKKNLVWGQPWCKLFKADIVKTNSIKFRTSLNLCEDWVFTMDYIECIDSIYITNYIGYGWNTDNIRSLSRGCDYQDRLDSYDVALERLHQLFLSKGIEDDSFIEGIRRGNWQVAIYYMYTSVKKYPYKTKIQRIKQFFASQDKSCSLFACTMYDIRMRCVALKTKILN